MGLDMNLKKPKAIIFDWDNTLVEGWQGIRHALNTVFEKYDMPLWSELEVKQRAHRSTRDVFPSMFGERASEALDVFYDSYRSFSKEQQTLEGVEELLGFLSSLDIRKAVVSNKSGELLRKEVDAKGFTKYFSKVVGAKDAVSDKPSAEPVKLVLEGSGIALGEHVWFVGDSTIDMLCAKNSNSSPILYGDKIAAHDLDANEIPHMHVANHYELIDLLKKTV